MKLHDLIIWTGILGEKIGLGLIIAVSTWGVIANGLCSFWNLRIGPRGLIVIWVGVILILISKRADKKLK